jgi:hypothetical protein
MMTLDDLVKRASTDDPETAVDVVRSLWMRGFFLVMDPARTNPAIYMTAKGWDAYTDEMDYA